MPSLFLSFFFLCFRCQWPIHLQWRQVAELYLSRVPNLPTYLLLCPRALTPPSPSRFTSSLFWLSWSFSFDYAYMYVCLLCMYVYINVLPIHSNYLRSASFLPSLPSFAPKAHPSIHLSHSMACICTRKHTRTNTHGHKLLEKQFGGIRHKHLYVRSEERKDLLA